MIISKINLSFPEKESKKLSLTSENQQTQKESFKYKSYHYAKFFRPYQVCYYFKQNPQDFLEINSRMELEACYIQIG